MQSVKHHVITQSKHPKTQTNPTKTYNDRSYAYSAAQRHSPLSRKPLPKTHSTTFPPHPSQSQRLQGIRLTTPENIAAFALLQWRNPEVRHRRAEDHTRAENEEDDAVVGG